MVCGVLPTWKRESGDGGRERESDQAEQRAAGFWDVERLVFEAGQCFHFHYSCEGYRIAFSGKGSIVAKDCPEDLVRAIGKA